MTDEASTWQHDPAGYLLTYAVDGTSWQVTRAVDGKRVGRTYKTREAAVAAAEKDAARD